MRQQDSVGILQIVNHRVSRIGPLAGCPKLCEDSFVGFQSIENRWSRFGAGFKIEFVGLEFLAGFQSSRSKGIETNLPGNEIQEVTIAQIVLGLWGTDPRFYTRVTVVPSSVVIGPLGKPRLDKRCGGKVLAVGNRLWNERFQVKLFAARFQLAAILVPSMSCVPVFHAVQQRDDRRGPGQNDQLPPDIAPGK